MPIGARAARGLLRGERMIDPPRAPHDGLADVREEETSFRKFSGAYQTHVAVSYDSGLRESVRRLLRCSDYKRFRPSRRRRGSRSYSASVLTYIEACSIAPSKLVVPLAPGRDSTVGQVRVHPTGG